MVKLYHYATTLLICTSLLVGCASTEVPNKANTTTSPQVASRNAPTVAAPKSGAMSITGRLLSTSTGQPLAKAIIRLPEFDASNGTYILDGAQSPGATSDDQGFFTIENVTAHDYVIMVGDVYTKYVIVPDSSGKTQILKAAANKVVDLGEMHVNYTP